MDKSDVILTVFFEVFEFEGPAPLKVFEIVFLEEFELKVFELKGSLKSLEEVLEKVFGLKVFELEGAPPFEVFKLEVSKGRCHSNELEGDRRRGLMVGGDQQSTTKQRS
jgi:hypothetical protein